MVCMMIKRATHIGMRVTNGDGGIELVEQQSSWHANNVAAANNNGTLALDLGACAL